MNMLTSYKISTICLNFKTPIRHLLDYLCRSKNTFSFQGSVSFSLETSIPGTQPRSLLRKTGNKGKFDLRK